MAFVYEEIGEENRELWNSIGFKDWAEDPLRFSKTKCWAKDKEREEYLVGIGGFIDMPTYYDFSYEGTIIRMEVFCRGNGNRKDGIFLNWKINRMLIPKSIWNQKDEVVKEIIKAFSVFTKLVPPEQVIGIDVEVRCEPECVEVDYNGR